MNKIPLKNLFLTWLAWALIVIGFQALATARLKLEWPDRALSWTETETGPDYQDGRPYLLEPFMNRQAAWDSEYYLAIAVGGYEDLQVPSITVNEKEYALSYAFLPFYPFLIRIMATPLNLLGMAPVAAAALAGVLVSALGALAGMLAVYDLARESMDEAGAWRAAFYLLIFPTGFFLVQIYTEGLFVGLAFGSLALLRRGKWQYAALLAAAAAMTRAVGVCLVIPLGIHWLRRGDWIDLDLEWRQIFFHGLPWRAIGRSLVALAPLFAFLAWKYSYLGLVFDYVEANFFGRGFLNLGMAFYTWYEAFRSLFEDNPQRAAYYLIEFGAIILGVTAGVKCLRTDPEIAWFSLAVILISWGSGPAQGMHRYILGAPAVFLTLARWGRHPAFDRAWTLLSILLMGLLAMLFAFDWWVA